MNCIHGIGTSVVDYAIFVTHVPNDNVNFDLLNDHEHDSDNKPINLTLILHMQNNHILNM